jgi:hypothetical protein
MGIRFRKSIALGKFFRLNLSKSGVSLGVGPPGLNVNIGPRGVRQTVGLPGTGVYYRESHQWPKSAEVAPAATSTEPSNSALGWRIIGIALTLIAAVAYLGSGSPSPGSKGSATVAVPDAQPSTPPVTPITADRPLNRDEVREVQILLKKQGFNAGTPDGVMGPKTRAAALAFARVHQIKGAPSEPSLRVLTALRGQ